MASHSIASKYKTYGAQAFVALAGPIGGGLTGLISYIIYRATGNVFWLQAASLLIIFNLFNLMPLSSIFDAGQILRTISYSINYTTGMVCMTLSYVLGLIILIQIAPIIAILIALFGTTSALNEIRDWRYYHTGERYMCSDAYLNQPKRLTPWQLAATIGAYILTLVLLGALYHHVSHLPLSNYRLLFKK